ncbi:hypothetical protein BJ878DRAFT_509080 [Calycina marina]|uniref:Chromatin modification-related protein n=1 Tax=Calycina marina TaxID=1763456 RepID=A0A9P7Z212_9HELO|nr:hypothetical protein BJ878DRAFT_509080 [Calycina marina]
MKSARPPAADMASSRRAQPVRQARNNSTRSTVAGSRQFDSRGSIGGLDASGPEQAIEIFPAITHFADAITALPKELIRHFTLLKEVDAKIFAPEESLGQLIDAAMNAPLIERRRPVELQNALATTSVPMSAQGSLSSSTINGHADSVAPVPAAVENPADAPWDPANLPRRQLFQHCAFTMSGMLMSLDEKNHVISTAAEALNKQLTRIDDCWPHLEDEFSDEARNGSLTHWAYPENRTNKPTGSSRREITAVNTLSAAAQRAVDEAAARSDERRQAILAKKNKHHAESDFDDNAEGRHTQKKMHGNSKVRKATDTPAGVGLGISNATGANGNPPKRRKLVDKVPSGGVGMDRALSGVYGANGVAGKKVASPRDTPPGEGPKKRQRAPNGTNGHSRKRNNTVTSIAISPALASPPVGSTFPDTKPSARAPSPTANGNAKPTARVRQDSTSFAVAESSKQRPASAASSKPNSIAAGIPNVPAPGSRTGKILPDMKPPAKDPIGGMKDDERTVDDNKQEGTDVVGVSLPMSRHASATKREDLNTNGEDLRTTTVTTKSGRASKPSTPRISQFEPVRSRSARNALEAASNSKRSHKKGAGAAAQQLLASRGRDDEDASSIQGDDDEDEEINPDEPRYCYCNGVSYGEMVGCDNDACEREWFHLECVGLKVAPKDKVKWYCDDCKERLKGSKRLNSR